MTDLDWLKQNAYFSCSVPECGEEVSYHASDLAIDTDGKIYCHECWDEKCLLDGPGWHDLPRFMPFKPMEQMHAALRLALPVMRRSAAKYLSDAMRWGDLRSISPVGWDEIRPDLEAIVAAEACVGREEHDWPWLDAIIDSGEWRE